MKSSGTLCKTFVSLWILLLTLAACSATPGNKKDQATIATPPVPQIHVVEIIQMKFFPAEFVAKKGDTVIFVNHDLVAHDVTEETKKAWSSSPMQSEQTWKLKVTGSVNYYCSLHPVMKGSIVVE